MAALPYIQLYVADYLADTAHLKTIEHGAYMLLIFNYWQRGESFKAKNEQTLNERLATVARLSYDDWINVSETIKEFFETTETEWKHDRIERDLYFVNSKSSKAKAAGIASAKKRAKIKIADVKAKSNERSTDAKQTLNHTDTEADTDIKTYTAKNADAFSRFWVAYPKKQGKGAAEKAFAKIKNKSETLTMIIDALSWQTKSEQWLKDGGQYIPNPATYINQQRWLDEGLDIKVKNKQELLEQRNDEVTERWLRKESNVS